MCNLLARRLNELAGFLNSLLKNDCIMEILSTFKRDEIQEAVNRSLDLSRDLCVHRGIMKEGINLKPIIHYCLFPFQMKFFLLKEK